MNYSKKVLSNVRRGFIKGLVGLIDVLVDIDNGNGSNGEPYIDEDGNELRLALDTDENGVAIVNLSIRQRNTNMTISITGPIEDVVKDLDESAFLKR